MTEDTTSARDLKRNALEFFTIELDLAFTFLETAAMASTEEHRLQAVRDARAAYDAVARLSRQHRLSDEEKAALQARMKALRQAIAAFDPK